MEFRELVWAQQLHQARLQYGPAADATERSYPNYPANALRELIRQSQHPHNLEPLLLTLRNPANTKTRERFSEIAGELSLVEKILSKETIVQDLQVVMGGEVVKEADGILYPTKENTVPYEVWIRIEMLDALTIMINEGLVKSLIPVMQQKLVEDLLELANDPEQHELLRLYAFVAAYHGAKHFHAARPQLLQGSTFISSVEQYLNSVLKEHSSSSIFNDPLQLLKAVATATEALYLPVHTYVQQDKNNLKSSKTLSDLELLPNMHPYLEAGLMPLISQALQKAWSTLQNRDSSQIDSSSSSDASSTGQVSFDDNWQQYLKHYYDTDFVPFHARVAIELGGALLQLMANQVGRTPACHTT